MLNYFITLFALFSYAVAFSQTINDPCQDCITVLNDTKTLLSQNATDVDY
jgi:hypothetical protein